MILDDNCDDLNAYIIRDKTGGGFYNNYPLKNGTIKCFVHFFLYFIRSCEDSTNQKITFTYEFTYEKSYIIRI